LNSLCKLIIDLLLDTSATRYQLQKFIGRRISLADSDSPKIKENGNAYQPKEKTVKKNRCCTVVLASM